MISTKCAVFVLLCAGLDGASTTGITIVVTLFALAVFIAVVVIV